MATPSSVAQVTPKHLMSLHDLYIVDGKGVPPLQQTALAPDISYTPNLSRYLSRVSEKTRSGNLEKEVPSGWPKYLDSPLTWTGVDFPKRETYVHQLSSEEKADIEKALEYFKGLGLNGDEVSRDRFPLTILNIFLEEARRDLSHGTGFFILRGLNPENYTAEDLTVIFLGISSYISGKRGRQDETGRMLTHITDCAASCSRHGLSPTEHSKIAQPFHADNACDIIGVLARSCAAHGGGSILSSSWRVYNELAATRPDIIHVLATADWPVDSFGRDPPYSRRALLHHHEGNIILSFARPPLTGHHSFPRSAGIPNLTEAQAEALDTVHFIAQSHQLITTIEAGDIRFFNNLGLLHCREPYEDKEGQRRHLVRLWLRDETGEWPLPPSLKLSWARVFQNDGRQERWEIEPPAVDWEIIRHRVSHGD